jgi:hypothetical protein
MLIAAAMVTHAERGWSYVPDLLAWQERSHALSQIAYHDSSEICLAIQIIGGLMTYA